MAELPVGTIIGERYRVVRVLGSGGFGTVYEAQHIHMSRAVAVKVLDVPSDKPNHREVCRRFIQEAEAASRIEHSNVVTIYDVGYTGPDHQPFIAMQLLKGHDLHEELEERGPMAPERALPLFVDCLDALSAAHALGIIHKDLKPGNLFLSDPGTRRERLDIVDFGMASILELDTSRITATGQFLGTPKYVAPEYVRTQTATPSLDVYQMALILIEMLSGESVVQADHVYACIMMHCTGDLKLPISLLESPLRPVLMRALSFDHTQRYQNAAAFRDALEALDPAAIPRVSPRSPRRSLAVVVGKAHSLSPELAALQREMDAETVLADTPSNIIPPPNTPDLPRPTAPKTERTHLMPPGETSLEMQQEIRGRLRRNQLLIGALALLLLLLGGAWIWTVIDESRDKGPNAQILPTPEEPRQAPPEGDQPEVRARTEPDVKDAPSPAVAEVDEVPDDNTPKQEPPPEDEDATEEKASPPNAGRTQRQTPRTRPRADKKPQSEDKKVDKKPPEKKEKLIIAQ